MIFNPVVMRSGGAKIYGSGYAFDDNSFEVAFVQDEYAGRWDLAVSFPEGVRASDIKWFSFFGTFEIKSSDQTYHNYLISGYWNGETDFYPPDTVELNVYIGDTLDSLADPTAIESPGSDENGVVFPDIFNGFPDLLPESVDLNLFFAVMVV